MRNNTRLNIRIPEDCRRELEAAAQTAGYASAAMLARCVLVQFLRHRTRMREMAEQTTGWMDSMAEEAGHDPRNRRMINERL